MRSYVGAALVLARRSRSRDHAVFFKYGGSDDLDRTCDLF